MSTEFNSTVEINSTHPGRFPRPGRVVVRAEEALIVIFVLLLWVAAIALFFNRWGKIRMLEPYQPKFQQQQRVSCAIVDSTPVSDIACCSDDLLPLETHESFVDKQDELRACSKFNIHCLDHSQCQSITRPRQNSVFLDSTFSHLANGNTSPRRSKSAFDLQSLVQAEEQHEEAADIAPMTFKPFNGYPKPSRSFQRERGMSICHFDRTDVLVRPLQRERGMSICHFDRMDVLARPLLRDRGMSICQFDRMDVLARPLARGSRPNIFSNVEGLGRCRGSRSSIGNFDGSTKFLFQRAARELRPSLIERAESIGRYTGRDRTASIVPYDRPSCSKTPDTMIGYKATCV